MLQRNAIPEALWKEALAALPFLADWPRSELNALREMSVLFLCEKNIIGAQGFVVTPFQRVVVAIQACIPVLKLGLEWYEGFKTIILYSHEFITNAEWEDEDGVIHCEEEPLMGETMLGGPVVLSWADLMDADRKHEPKREALKPPINPVIHEFVHKLDMKNGEANGCPPLPPELPTKRWQQIMGAAYADFCRRTDAGEDLGIDPYAAEEPSEFFAVLSETFFVAPKRLREAYPKVYECFQLFYGFKA
ncbi:MAG: zinc-dependent peptidase [Cystobacterineae bacterium]|nr:zinc-dependent peptidase [Cystobacterineae bacterium]